MTGPERRSQRLFDSTPSRKNQITDWNFFQIYNRPLINLIYDAATIHRKFHDPQQVQKATLLSIKTGGENL